MNDNQQSINDEFVLIEDPESNVTSSFRVGFVFLLVGLVFITLGITLGLTLDGRWFAAAIFGGLPLSFCLLFLIDSKRDKVRGWSYWHGVVTGFIYKEPPIDEGGGGPPSYQIEVWGRKFYVSKECHDWLGIGNEVLVKYFIVSGRAIKITRISSKIIQQQPMPAQWGTDFKREMTPYVDLTALNNLGISAHTLNEDNLISEPDWIKKYDIKIVNSPISWIHYTRGISSSPYTPERRNLCVPDPRLQPHFPLRKTQVIYAQPSKVLGHFRL